MPRGGLRIGAGRPKGATKAAMEARKAAGVVASAEILRATKKTAPPSKQAKVKAPKKPAAAKFAAGMPPGAAGVKTETAMVDAPVAAPKDSGQANSVGGEQQVPIRPAVMKTPMQHLFDRMNDPSVPAERRDTLAIALAPYMHAKTGEVGKKELAQMAAEDVSSGKFATAAPPKLSVVARQ